MKYKIENLKWKQFWKLTIVSEAEWKRTPNWSTKRYVNVTCECWWEKILQLQKVVKMETTNCWCKKFIPKNRREDIYWKKYNRLTIIEDDCYKNNKRYVKVKCDCWTNKTIELYSVTSWNVKSCWCLQKESIKRAKHIRDRVRITSAKRRALKKSTEDWTVTEKAINELIFMQSNKCNECSKDLIDYHIDHIVPLIKWWEHSIYNCQILCPTCNMQKSDKL